MYACLFGKQINDWLAKAAQISEEARVAVSDLRPLDTDVQKMCAYAGTPWMKLTVYEQGLNAIPLSIDLWIHYISFAASKYENEPDKVQIIRRLYEKAITAAGTDFRSDKLWDTYINWERGNKNLKAVTALYDRILTIPTQLYSHNFENFCDHVQHSIPKDVLSLDEFLKLRQEILSSKSSSVQPDASGDDDTDAPPGAEGNSEGVDSPPGVDGPPGEETPPGMEKASKDDDDETRALREKVIGKRRVIHQVTEQEVSKRWSYEEAIRRPYFHVKPLEKGQLKNWREYLDYEIENGTHERVVVLFERCMIACALYEDCWIKYAKYMEPHSLEGVRHVYRRACNVHLPKKPSIHLAWAAFEERQGNYKEASDILSRLETNMPNLAMVMLRRISLERRQGNFTRTEELYRSYMEKAEMPETRTFFAIKYARYLSKVMGDHEKSRSVLEEALQKDENNHKLYLQLIDLEYQKAVVNEQEMLEFFSKAINSSLAIEHRVAFSQRKLEFLEDFSSNVNRVLEAYDEHQKLLKELQTTKKRKSQSLGEDQQADKKIKTEPSSANGSSNTMSTTGQAAPPVNNNATTATHGMDPNAAYNYNQTWSGYTGGYPYQHPGWGAYSGYYGTQ